jgi:BlaI family penicillinase repressor
MPTNAELAILRVLWNTGPCTVRFVHDVLYDGTGVGYTSALKLLQNMLEKGLVTRREHSKQHVYLAAVQERRTMNALVRRWIENSFAGSSAALAMRALEAKPITREELVRLKALVEQLEKKESKP